MSSYFSVLCQFYVVFFLTIVTPVILFVFQGTVIVSICSIYCFWAILSLVGPAHQLLYEGRSKSFAIQYDVQMAQTKQLHYFSM